MRNHLGNYLNTPEDMFAEAHRVNLERLSELATSPAGHTVQLELIDPTDTPSAYEMNFELISGIGKALHSGRRAIDQPTFTRGMPDKDGTVTENMIGTFIKKDGDTMVAKPENSARVMITTVKTVKTPNTPPVLTSATAMRLADEFRAQRPSNP